MQVPSFTDNAKLSKRYRMKKRHPSPHLPQTPWLILFDGICGWCTGWVRFLIHHDTQKRLQFAPLQSPLGQQQLEKYHLSQENFSTFVVIAPDGYFTKSTAALRIMRHLGGRWRILYAFILIPQSLRDGVYDLIARYRYQLRGKLTACYRPPPEYQDRFRYEF